jgi:hypothetical protein
MAAFLSCIVWRTVLIAHLQDTNAMHTAWHQTPAWLLFATGLMVMPSVAASSGRFVPGDVVVQFDPGSEGHRLVMQASRQSVPDLSDFAPLVGRLERDIGILLTPKQLLSGQRLLLGIDTNRIVRESAGRLRRKPGVRTVGPDETGSTPSQSSSGGLPIRIEFTQDSPLDRLAEAADHPDSPAGRELLSDIQTDLEIPLTIRTVHEHTVVLDVDLPALTHLAVQRLSAASEIREAQLNYLVSIPRPQP